MFSTRPIVLTALSAVIVAACGGGGASAPAKADTEDPLSVDVCTEGDSRDTIVFFKNLNDFEWQDVTFSVTKGGQQYTLGEEAQSMQGGREKPKTWPPETVRAAEPFVEAGDFTYRPTGGDRGTSHKAPLNRLTYFGFLESASVEVERPYELEWSGTVHSCN